MVIIVHLGYNTCSPKARISGRCQPTWFWDQVWLHKKYTYCVFCNWNILMGSLGVICE